MEGLNETLVATSFVIGSYVVGSIPFGLLIGKLTKGIDIREFGSGSTGATNVARTCGPMWGLFALILDMGKAAIPVYLAVYIIGTPKWSHSFMGLAAILGHVYPIFTSFKGGKGVASGWAALIVLSPWAGLAATITAGPLIGITRYVSLGSIVGSAVGGGTIAVLAFLGYCPTIYAIFGTLGAAVTIALHRDNIGRLIRGEESKLGDEAEIHPRNQDTS